MKYNINNNNIYELLSKIKETIQDKKINMESLLEIDYKYSNFKVDISILNKIIEKFQKEKINIDKEQKVIVHYNGNPYLTLNLSILAILTKTILILEFDEYMLGINSFITKIINFALNELQTENLIFIAKRDDKLSTNIDKIICIDDINTYNKYLYNKIENVQFIPFNYIDFYCDSESLEELSELIYKYGENNLISIESYSEFEISEAIEKIKEGHGKKLVLLTDKEDTKERFKNTIKSKEIYINKNPFDTDICILDKEIFLI